MKIILVVTDSKRKNLVFVSDKLDILSLDEAVKLAKEGKIEGTHTVRRSSGVFLRTNKNIPRSQELETMALSFSQLSSFHDDINGLVSTPFSNYLKLYENALRARGGDFIIIDARPLATKEDIKNKLQPHKNIIFEAADHFHIDSYLLGAILIDEIARTAPLENIFNNVTVNFLGRNTSLGIAQMKTDTAYDLVKSNLYNPNPNDEFLKHKLNPAVRSRLYEYLIQPKHSIFFAAAGIRSLINNWKRFINLENRPEILATLYSRKYKDPHVKPESNERGLQIANEFYSLAEQWLK